MYIQKKHHVLWRKGQRNIRTAFLRTQIEVRDTLILAESILVQPVVAFICRQGCGIRGGNEAEAFKRHFPGIETGLHGLKRNWHVFRPGLIFLIPAVLTWGR